MVKHTRGSYDDVTDVGVRRLQYASLFSLPTSKLEWLMSGVDPVVIEYCEVMVRRLAF